MKRKELIKKIKERLDFAGETTLETKEDEYIFLEGPKEYKFQVEMLDKLSKKNLKFLLKVSGKKVEKLIRKKQPNFKLEDIDLCLILVLDGKDLKLNYFDYEANENKLITLGV